MTRLLVGVLLGLGLASGSVYIAGKLLVRHLERV